MDAGMVVRWAGPRKCVRPPLRAPIIPKDLQTWAPRVTGSSRSRSKATGTAVVAVPITSGSSRSATCATSPPARLLGKVSRASRDLPGVEALTSCELPHLLSLGARANLISDRGPGSVCWLQGLLPSGLPCRLCFLASCLAGGLLFSSLGCLVFLSPALARLPRGLSLGVRVQRSLGRWLSGLLLRWVGRSCFSSLLVVFSCCRCCLK